MSNDPGLPGEGVGVLLDRYITHQELYASAWSKEGQNGGGRQFTLIVLVPLEQLGWGGALTSV